MSLGETPSGQAAGFPWGDNRPGVRERLLVALVIASVAAIMHYVRAAEHGGYSDFTSVWYGARFMFEGRNPYDLIGPGLLVPTPSPAYYPATAFVAALPLALIPFHLAGAVFVFLSATLLAWGCTRDGWHRLPMFPSIAFLTSAQLGQWSIIFTAAVFIPAIAFISLAKPQAAMPVVTGNGDSRAFWWAVAGGAALTAVSFYLMPAWIGDWWALLGSSDHFVPPIQQFGGAAIALVLIRWRRPEAWLVFIAACLPQTWYPYNGLILMVVAFTYREACILSLVSSTGWLLSALVGDGNTRSPETREIMSATLIAACYLPATIMVLRRPNQGPQPFWMRWFQRREGVYIAASGR